jgi:hypothetical protein
MNGAFLFDGEDQRLDRVPAPTLTPPNGSEFDISQPIQVSIQCQGWTIVYKSWTAGQTPQTAPESITDGTAVANQVTVGGGFAFNVVCRAFDPSNTRQPSVPVSGSYVRYDMSA